ncbi:phosphatase PAP2 family protein [Xylanimonas allomyrinae]|uniref:phosphatase PAP2 family protein n=1 Tax=Xylanimonas allomyrinae TaxID=2509459 RepID=UPI001FED163D|nr:phosphatase PAP2 family protein [Xylanimonas allomyrinae]
MVTWLRDRPGFLRLAVGGLGAIVSYATSEAVKTLVAQPRPCHTLDVVTALTCPTATDWSWPSNHATIAGSIAVACLLVAPRLWPLLVPLAAIVATARVGAGVHYLHDITAGLALGTLITALISTYATPALARIPLVQRATRRSAPRADPPRRRAISTGALHVPPTAHPEEGSTSRGLLGG